MAWVTLREGLAPVEIRDRAGLESVLAAATDDAIERGCPNVIFIEVDSGNSLSLVVGAGNRTAVSFRGHGPDGRYLMSRGSDNAAVAVLDAAVAGSGRIELLANWLVPRESGWAAALEFVETGDLPQALEWMDLVARI